MPSLLEARPQHIHTNSLRAYRNVNLPQSFARVLAVFDQHDRPLTDREVKELGGFSDLNECRPRISEMLKPLGDGEIAMLKEFDSVVCQETHKLVRRCIINRGINQQLKFF